MTFKCNFCTLKLVTLCLLRWKNYYAGFVHLLDFPRQLSVMTCCLWQLWFINRCRSLDLKALKFATKINRNRTNIKRIFHKQQQNTSQLITITLNLILFTKITILLTGNLSILHWMLSCSILFFCYRTLLN